MRFDYVALDAAGRTVRGRLDSEDPIALARTLSQRHLQLLEARRCWRPMRSVRLDREHLLHFCYQLQQLMQAGIPLIDGLQTMADEDERQGGRLASELHAYLEQGDSLSQALARLGQAVPPYIVALIAAGEQSGRLAAILQRLVRQLEQETSLARQRQRALLYPACLLLTVLTSLGFVLTTLVPQLATFLQQLGRPPEGLLAILHAMSRQLAQANGLTLASGLLCLSLPAALATHPRLAGPRRRLLEGLPILGPALRELNLSRLYATFGLLYGAGITVLEALTLTAATLDHPRLRQALQDSTESIASGQGIAAALAATVELPPVSQRLLRIGEHSGQLEETLHHLATWHGNRALATLDRLQALLEPTLTLIFGGLLGGLLLSVLGPVYDLLGQWRP